VATAIRSTGKGRALTVKSADEARADFERVKWEYDGDARQRTAMDLTEAIYTRRAVREYTAEPMCRRYLLVKFIFSGRTNIPRVRLLGVAAANPFQTLPSQW
jgi:hypothetical protein